MSSGGLPTLAEACLASSESLLGDKLPCLQQRLSRSGSRTSESLHRDAMFCLLHLSESEVEAGCML